MAITFMESGEHETARKILKETDLRIMNRPSVSKRPRQEYRASPPRK